MVLYSYTVDNLYSFVNDKLLANSTTVAHQKGRIIGLQIEPHQQQWGYQDNTVGRQ